VTLDIFELLFSVPTSRDKVNTLQHMSIKVDLLKILLRLAKDSQALENKNYVRLESILVEIGRMLGGWIRATRQNSTQDKLL